MSQFTLAIGFGLVTSSILALCAVGFTLQFGVSNIFNLAFGGVMTVSAFVAYWVNVDAGASLWLALAAGAGTRRGRPTRNHRPDDPPTPPERAARGAL